jgi:hypothetical protein
MWEQLLLQETPQEEAARIQFRADRWPEVATIVMIQKQFELIQGPKTVFKKSSMTFAVCGMAPY